MSTQRDENNRAGAYHYSDKPLFTRPRDGARQQVAKLTRPRNEPDQLEPDGSPASRIPTRVSSPGKPPVTLRSAWERALREENPLTSVDVNARPDGGQGSPSPAPRARAPITETQREKDERRMRRLREASSVTRGGALDFRPPPTSKQELGEADTIGSNASGSSLTGSWAGAEPDFTDDDIDRKLKQHEKDQKRAAAVLGSQKGLFAKGRVGGRAAGILASARRDSESSIDEHGVRGSNVWGRKARPTSGWMHRILSPESSDEARRLPERTQSDGTIDWNEAGRDAPLKSIEEGSFAQEPTPPHSRPSSAQPTFGTSDVSQMWDADLDFTARSLQISDSPQLKIRPTKLDEIRQREIENLSKRAIATARLEDIKERNSEERSVSPEVRRKPSEEHLSKKSSTASLRNGGSKGAYRSGSESPSKRMPKTLGSPSRRQIAPVTTPQENNGASQDEKGNDFANPEPSNGGEEAQGLQPTEDIAREAATENLHASDRTILDEDGERIPNTPITIFKATAEGIDNLRPGHRREDSLDTLRKLARVTSVSPRPPEQPTTKVVKGPDMEKPKTEPTPLQETTSANSLTINIEKATEEVARQFEGVAARSKRNSTTSTPPKSEADPEERIQAEASLFELAPVDSRSERNSIRFPSPEREQKEEETPRPRSGSFIASLPTPVVTGAYIDTPATARPGRRGRFSSGTSDEEAVLDDESSRAPTTRVSAGFRTARESAMRNRASRESSRTSTSSKRPKPRPRSLPPLVNSAKLASIEDDLRDIRREERIEDSTLDNFDELLNTTDELDADGTTILEHALDLETDEKSGRTLSDRERERRQELVAIERMNKTVKSSLRSIRDAKRGIEAIEDKVNHSTSSTTGTQNHEHKHTACPACMAHSPYYHLTIPIPRLWSRDPTKWKGVRFTWLGLIIAVFLTWYIAETVTCEFICHPLYAGSATNWHPSDPFWGYALPVFLDRCTGGALGVVWNVVWGFVVWVWNAWTGGGDDEMGNMRWVEVPEVPPMPSLGKGWSEGSMFDDEAL